MINKLINIFNSNLIDAEKAFEEKKKMDEWWKKALERLNNVGKPIKEKNPEEKENNS